jgi:hypothetical protein
MLYERWMDREDRLDYRASLIAAFVANCAPKTSKTKRKPVQPSDIIKPIRERSKPSDETLEELTPEQQLAALEMQFGPVVEVDQLPPGLR